MMLRLLAGIMTALLAASCRHTEAGTPPASPAVSNVMFVAFDLETTGFGPTKDRIIEIGAVKFRNGTIQESRRWLVNPGIPMPASAQRINGITDAQVADAPAFREAYPEFLLFTRETVLLAHNAVFDMRFLRAECKRNGLSEPTNTVLNTLPLSRLWFPDAKDHSLPELTRHLNLQPALIHRATEDAQSVMAVFTLGMTNLAPHATLEDLTNLADSPAASARTGRRKAGVSH